jgi:hypothetical protein
MIRRTTLAAESSDLEVFEIEARKRRVSLTLILREVVAEAAAQRRAQRPKPRFGIFEGSGEPVAQLIASDEEAPARGRLQSQ